MALNLTDVFTTLGLVGKLATENRINQTAMSTDIEAIRAQLNSIPLTPPLTAFDQLKATGLLQMGGWIDNYSSLAQSIVMSFVYADKPSAASSFESAVQELIRQMVTASASVQSMTVSASIVDGTNKGDGKFYVTSTRYDGSEYGLLFNESSVRIACTADSQPGGGNTPTGREIFTYSGNPVSLTGSFSPWSNDFPLGSGTQTNVTSITPSSGSLLGSDGLFKTYSATTPFGPTGWTVTSGTSGAQFAQETTTTYNGTACLKLLASGTLFAANKAPSSTLAPNAQYFLGVRLKASSALTGVLRFSVTDSAGTVVTGGDGSPMRVDINLNTVSTSAFGAHGGWFKTPILVPSGAKIKMEVQTAISGGNLYVDWLSLSAPTALYAGGPLAVAIAGVANFAQTDYFTLTTTNNYGGASNLATWQWFWDRIFLYLPRTRNLYLPTSNSPTIADSLLT